MKLFLIAISLLISSLVMSQDTIGLKKATASLNEALLKKEAVILQKLLDDNTTYGHSNGWLQSKKEVLNDFVSGKIEYTLIENIGDEKYTVHSNAVAINCITKVAGVVNGNVFNMNLQVLQVWKRIKKQWVLIARQSVKVS